MVCVNSICVSPEILNMEVGQYGYPNVSVSPSNATCKDVRWSSSNSDVASVNYISGYVYAKSAGTAIITARATDGSGETDTLTVFVSEPEIVWASSVQVTPECLTLTAGDDAQAYATVYPINVTDSSVTWSSEDPSIAIVDLSGKITAISHGETRIYATANDCGGKRDYVYVTVVSPSFNPPVRLVTSVEVDPSFVNLTAGEVYTGVWATVLPSNASNKELSWISSDCSIATVDEDGIITAVSQGVATITAYATDGSGKYDSIQVAVNPQNAPVVKVEKVTISPISVNLEEGDIYGGVCVSVQPSNATNKGVEWSTTNTNVATVNPDSGIITARNKGVAKIFAYAKDGHGANDYITVNVSECECDMVLVESMTISNNSIKVVNGFRGPQLSVSVSPLNASNKSVKWVSSNPAIVTVDAHGHTYGKSVGTAIITAYTTDGSGLSQSCMVTVEEYVPVTSITVTPETATVNMGETITLSATVQPSNASFRDVIWSSSDDSVVNMCSDTSLLYAEKPGIVTITACAVVGECSDCCEIWVKGKTPVFLIHGRTSHSNDTWGLNNEISIGENSHSGPNENAVTLNGKSYTSIDSQSLSSFVENNGDKDSDYPCNLGNELRAAGYKENINLFAFNYPNEDAVKYSAQKFKAYIENLISHVRTSDNNEMKACFYSSRNDYNNDNYRINIVGHSMGGLVARYYIENLGQDTYVDKLITICTPHWGSGYAGLSSNTGFKHKLCDHDLEFNSAMFGGNSSINLDCSALFSHCHNFSNCYILTDRLLYDKTRSTKYYAIAGIDLPLSNTNENDLPFEMPTDFTTIQQIIDYFNEKGIYHSSNDDELIEIQPQDISDNMVGFLSQIGWIGDYSNVNTPEPKIQMEKIFIDVDSNGGNSFTGEFGLELLYGFGSEILHNKIPHRKDVCGKIIEYLEE